MRAAREFEQAGAVSNSNLAMVKLPSPGRQHGLAGSHATSAAAASLAVPLAGSAPPVVFAAAWSPEVRRWKQ